MNTFLFGLLVWAILGSQVFQLPQTSFKSSTHHRLFVFGCGPLIWFTYLLGWVTDRIKQQFWK